MVARGFYAEAVVMAIGSFSCLALLISILLSQRFQPLDAHPRIRAADRWIVLLTLFAVLLQTTRGVDASGAFGLYPPAVYHLFHSQTTAVICQVVTVILVATLRTLYFLLNKPVPRFVVPAGITASLLYYFAVSASAIAEFFVNTSTASDLDLYVFLFVRNMLLIGYVIFAIAGSGYLMLEIRATSNVVIQQLNDAQIRQAKQMISDAEHLIHDSQGATGSNNSFIHVKVSGSPVTTPPRPNRTLAVAINGLPLSSNPEVVPMLTAEPAENAEEKNQLPPAHVATIHHVRVESNSALTTPFARSSVTNYVGEIHSNSAKIVELKLAVRRLFLFLIGVDTIGAGGVLVTLHQNVAFIRGNVNMDDYMISNYDVFPGFRLVAFIFHMGVFAVIIWSAYLPVSIWMSSPYPFWRTLCNGPPRAELDSEDGSPGNTKPHISPMQPQMNKVQQQPAQHEHNGKFIRVPADALSPGYSDHGQPDPSILPSKMSSLQLGHAPKKVVRPVVNNHLNPPAVEIEESSERALHLHISSPPDDGQQKGGERDRHRLTIGKQLRANVLEVQQMEPTQTVQLFHPSNLMDTGTEYVEASPDAASALLDAADERV